MNEYKKKLAAMQQGQVNNESAPEAPEMTNGIPNSVLNDVFAGKKHATSEMMGHKQNLAPSIAAKMSAAFGMDLTGMQVYRSDAMAGTGMKGLSQGNKVILSSDIDLNTGEGQAVLGHELSHVHAQAQGIGMGHSGLYNNAALEAQADREGMLAAHGRPIYDQGMTGNPGMSYGLGMKGVEGVTPLSANGISSTAGAPMQAKKKKDKEKADILKEFALPSEFMNNSSDIESKEEDDMERYNESQDDMERDNESQFAFGMRKNGIGDMDEEDRKLILDD